MRGSLERMHWRVDDLGIIPAHAGLTCRQAPLHCRRGDHPRACGAHCDAWRKMATSTGSSPRMRGSQQTVGIEKHGTGIIPAHAGLTLKRRQIITAVRDHPRACGAHIHRPQTRAVTGGSSPRMRGSQSLSLKRAANPGIIPAHAGLTHTLPVIISSSRDHPRACGAHR